jgi:hypothetical protein
MGTPGETDTRLTTLERKQGETATAQEKMQLQLNRQEERFAQTLDILVDHSDAISYLTKHLAFYIESLEHALMISSATTNLPAS